MPRYLYEGEGSYSNVFFAAREALELSGEAPHRRRSPRVWFTVATKKNSSGRASGLEWGKKGGIQRDNWNQIFKNSRHFWTITKVKMNCFTSALFSVHGGCEWSGGRKKGLCYSSSVTEERVHNTQLWQILCCRTFWKRLLSYTKSVRKSPAKGKRKESPNTFQKGSSKSFSKLH